MQQRRVPLSFERDILPLFRAVDIDHMAPMGVMLDDFAWMSDAENAAKVHQFLTGELTPRMPPGGPFWSDEQLGTFSAWMEGGRQP